MFFFQVPIKSTGRRHLLIFIIDVVVEARIQYYYSIEHSANSSSGPCSAPLFSAISVILRFWQDKNSVEKKMNNILLTDLFKQMDRDNLHVVGTIHHIPHFRKHFIWHITKKTSKISVTNLLEKISDSIFVTLASAKAETSVDGSTQ